MDELIARARRLAGASGRRVLGITGAPGAGKSTLAQRLADELAGAAVLVPMDGFHLANATLDRLGRRARKGAPDTFDAHGFAALLRRLREGGPTVYAPRFHREIEEPIAGAIAVPPDVALVITEGNYLLLDEGDWAPVRELLDEAWYLDCDEEVRLAGLIARHEEFGKSPADARAWALGTDQRNAVLIEATRARADLVVSRPVSGSAYR
jgi:pantothenate kinase